MRTLAGRARLFLAKKQSAYRSPLGGPEKGKISALPAKILLYNRSSRTADDRQGYCFCSASEENFCTMVSDVRSRQCFSRPVNSAAGMQFLLSSQRLMAQRKASV